MLRLHRKRRPLALEGTAGATPPVCSGKARRHAGCFGYALLDGRNQIEERHLDAALALWRYAQDSALYIFGDRAADPLEEKVLEALKQGPLTATELSAVFCRNIARERLQPVLQQLEAQQRISISKIKGAGRPKLIIGIREISIINEKSEKNEFDEKREAVC